MMKITVMLLLLTVTVVRGKDNCKSYFHYLCGDLCIHQKYMCHCGNDTLDYKYKYYCCLPPPPPGDTEQCKNSTDGAGHCPTGGKLRISEPCQGSCFNQYQNNTSLGSRSQFRCANGQCVWSGSLCRFGYAVWNLSCLE